MQPQSRFLSLIGVRTKFNGTHRFQNAPEKVAFLREYHNHEFHVVAEIEVNHLNRDLEFLMVKATIDRFIKVNFAEKQTDLSCEQMASQIMWHLMSQYPNNRILSVSVQEDNADYAKVVQLSSPKTKLRSKPFAGIDAEGPWKGTPTLFIPCCNMHEHRIQQLQVWLAKAREKLGCEAKTIMNIYYGADNHIVTKKDWSHAMNNLYALLTTKDLNLQNIIVEGCDIPEIVDVYRHRFEKLGVILHIISSDPKDINADYFKQVDPVKGIVTLTDCENPTMIFETELDSEIYKTDVSL